MSVKIRMTRMGRRHRPFFRINAVESRTPRDGKILEKLGHYDPIEKDKDKQTVLDIDRIKYWLEKGAVPSESVTEMLIKHGLEVPGHDARLKRRRQAKSIARANGKLFNKAEREAAAKKAEAEKSADAAGAK